MNPSVTKRFLIISQARSGSTMLGSALGRHPQVLMHGEIFGAHHFPLNFYGLNESLPWPTPIEIMLKKMRDKNPIQFLQDMVFAETGRSAVGFKFKFEEFSIWPSVVEYVTQNNILIIYISRENSFDRYLSEIEAEATGFFNTSDNTTYSANSVEDIKRRLSFDSVKRAIEGSIGFDALFDTTFKASQVLRVTYEQCLADWPLRFASACEFLGIDKVALQPISEKRSEKKRIHEICDIDALRTELCEAGFAAVCGRP